MVEDESWAVAERTAAEREVQDELLLQAVSALRRRYEGGGSYSELTPSAAAELGDRLAAIAAAPHSVDEPGITQAVALAHRLIDDDHPEVSPMWPGTAG